MKAIPWSRLLVESALIVLSILLAFGIQAWWEQRGQEARERAVLFQIAEDFRVHRSSIQGAFERHTERAEAAAMLLRLVGPEADVETEEAIEWLGRISNFNPLTLQAGMLETVLSTDGLSIIEDPDLRTALIVWGRRAEDALGVQDFVISEVRAWGTFLSDRRPLRAPGAFGGVQVSGSEFRWNPNELFRDLEFENLVFQQAYASTALANRLDALAELTLEIIQGIESSD